MRLMDVFKSGELFKKIVDSIQIEMREKLSEVLTTNFFLLCYGAYEIDPKHLVFWICVGTDEIKEVIAENRVLVQDLRNVISKNDYPIDNISDILIGFESQETVDRVSKGDWHLHFQ